MTFAVRLLRLLALLAALGIVARGATAAAPTGPITFAFTVPAAAGIKNPFARELWGRVILPSGEALVLPAYYAGEGVYAVRARPDAVGLFRLDQVVETTRGQPATPVKYRTRGSGEFNNPARIRLPFVARDPAHPASFIRADGRPFVPFGTNLAWPDGDCVPYYRSALAAFAHANLNWMRIWMVHWGQLNLDWVPEWLGSSPKPGGIDPGVAARWDEIIQTAGAQGVYLQVVLQHHGQYSTGANSNWADNPWNAAQPGGFLKTPGEFFTDPAAILLTQLKYRYIVARWGWSPAIFAWELFNEVHWVDAMAKDHQEAAVARWHNAMADSLRAVDAYHHLVTTSTEDLRSPVYEKMDFYQPHLYAANMIAGPRSFVPAADPDRPVFYGEFGNDHLPVSTEVKRAGLTDMPSAWASIMGRGPLPAQLWEGAPFLAQGRLGELGALHRFYALNRFPARTDLTPFSAVVESTVCVPLLITAGHVWQHRPSPDLAYPLDGREPLDAAEIPGIYLGHEEPGGFPSHATYHLDFPRASTLRVKVPAVGAGGAALRVSVDGRAAVEQRWPGPPLPTELSCPITAGPHTVVVENPGGPDWVEVSGLDTGLDTSVLAAIGRRNDTLVAVWLWHRTNLYALNPGPTVAGTLVLDDVPAGTWQVTWWDTGSGIAAAPVAVVHPGGPLRLATPAISRHAAVALTR